LSYASHVKYKAAAHRVSAASETWHHISMHIAGHSWTCCNLPTPGDMLKNQEVA